MTVSTITEPSLPQPVTQRIPAVVSRLRPRTPIDLATARVSVLVPVYNERDTVETIVDLIQSSPIQKEIICVDDASTDGTKEILEGLLAAGKIDTLFRQPVNCGKGAAIRRALSLSTGDIVIVQDADLEYDPADWPVLFEPIIDGRFDQVEKIGLQAHQQRLALGITESNIKLEHFRALIRHHEARV